MTINSSSAVPEVAATGPETEAPANHGFEEIKVKRQPAEWRLAEVFFLVKIEEDVELRD